MFKTTITYVVVSLIIVHSCLVTSNPNVQPDSNIKQRLNSITNSILKQSEDAEFYTNLLIHITSAFISRECSDKQGMFSSLLNNSMESMFKKFIEGYKTRLAEIRIPQIPGFNYMFLNDTAFFDIKLTNIVLKHLDTVSISKLEYDVCKVSSEIDIKLPTFDMEATYTLGGYIGNFPISGNGNFLLYVDSANYYKRSSINCESNILSEECDLSNMSTTTDIGAKQVMADVIGVNYKGLTESQVNYELNNYIKNYLKYDKTELKRQLTDMVLMLKKEHSMMYLNPLKMFTKMKENLKNVTSLIKQGNMSLPLSLSDTNTYLNFISAYL